MDELKEIALRELKTEALPIDKAVFSLDLDMKFGGLLNVLRVNSPCLSLQSEADGKTIYEAFAREYAKVYSPFSIIPEAGVDVLNFVLKTSVPRPRLAMPSYELRGEMPHRDAFKGKRPMYWEEYNGFRETPVYEQRLLESGNIIEGPAVVESEDTTVVLPPENRINIDTYRCFIIEKM